MPPGNIELIKWILLGVLEDMKFWKPGVRSYSPKIPNTNQKLVCCGHWGCTCCVKGNACQICRRAYSK